MKRKDSNGGVKKRYRLLKRNGLGRRENGRKHFGEGRKEPGKGRRAKIILKKSGDEEHMMDNSWEEGK